MAIDVSSTNGLLTFQNDPTQPFLAYEFRIMHASGCQPDSDNTVTDELQSYLGEDGLATLLAYLTAGPGRADEHGIAVRDMDEFVDLIPPCPEFWNQAVNQTARAVLRLSAAFIQSIQPSYQVALCKHRAIRALKLDAGPQRSLRDRAIGYATAFACASDPGGRASSSVARSGRWSRTGGAGTAVGGSRSPRAW